MYNSSEDKPTHPGGAECEGIGSPLIPNNSSIPFWGSSYDFCDIHRALSCDFGKVDEFLDTFFPTLTNTYPDNSNVFVIVLPKTSEYSGAANIKRRIATVASQYSTDGNFNSFDLTRPEYNLEDERAGAHEFAHIFAALQDEYFVPFEDAEGNCFDNEEELNMDEAEFYTAPNRFFFPEGQTISGIFPYFDPIADNNLPWNHWSGVTGLSVAIGNYAMVAFQVDPPCTIIQGEVVHEVRKPTTSQQAVNITSNVTSCFMRNIHGPFCAVCREAIIERIHDLTSPINSTTPSDLDATYEASSSLSFSVDLTTPNPNTIRVIWELEDEVDGGVFTELETDFNGAGEANGIPGNAGGEPSGHYRWNLDCTEFDGRSEGNYTVRARIFDMTANTEGANTRWVRHPQHEIDEDDVTNGNHEEIVEWTVHFNGIAGTDLYAEDIGGDGGLELDEGSDLDLWLSPDLWLCSGDNTGCPASGDGPSYTGAGSQAQVNLLVKNRGCKVFDAGQDNGTVKFWWAKAKTLLEWPEDWNGDEIAPSGPLKGDEIGSPIMMLEDIDITNTNGVVVVSTLWDIPDPDSYSGLDLELYDDNDITHFCFLALINSNNDPAEMIEVGDYRLYGSVLQSNNIVWRNVSIIDESSFTGGGSGQTTATDVIRGGGVIVSNNDSLSRNYKLKFEVPSSESGKPITEEAEVRIIFSDSLWSKWIDGGQQASSVSVYDSTLHQIKLNDTLCTISGMSIDSNSHFGMYVSVNFLTQERTSKELFTLHVTQILDDSTQRVLGGETYVIKPDPNRAYFTADAGDDKEVIIGNAYSQTAKAITDSAIYNWYNSSGVRLQTGITFSDSATTTSTETYKLEVIAKSDGYKDYDEVTISTKLGKLTSIVPNPISTGTLAIGYLVASSVSTPKIRIVNISTSAYTEHSISTGSGTLNVDISPYTTGSYSIILICDSTTADDELLVVQ